MSEAKSDGGVSRREMMTWIAAATGAATLGVALPASATPVEAVPHVAAAPQPHAGAALTAGLVHLLLDASAFTGKVENLTNGRYVDDTSGGAGVSTPPGNLVAPLVLG